ncbi:MAG: Gx transporter family protein [Clostridiales bacterium]|nr:Gx transporter family protein [Clostridiales bacterium]
MKSKAAEYGLLAALAMVLSYVEAQFPVFFAVPGMKLGLTNIVVLISLYRQGTKSAFAINLVRIVLTGFTFGNLFSMIYSLAGGCLSWVIMAAAKKWGPFSMTGVSVAGGVGHNIGQILVALFVLETGKLIYYLPFLMISGVAAGVVVGLIGSGILRRLPPSA